MVVEREEFEKMKDEYYGIRGWDVPTGLQTRASLETLDLGDVAEGLAKRSVLCYPRLRSVETSAGRVDRLPQ
jgi:hypothetical protein